jgi:predicted Rossmann fold nucleotide-binding protein DprA/Smf involved in DNA uptake
MITGELIREILKSSGVDPERFSLEWASAAEAPRFTKLITTFTEKIKEMGPLGQAEGIDRDELLLKLRAASSASEAMKLRTKFGKLTKGFRDEGDYSADVIKQKVEEKLAGIVKSEVGSKEILVRLEQGPLSLDDLAGKVNLTAEEIEGFLNKLGKKGHVSASEGRWTLAPTG